MNGTNSDEMMEVSISEPLAELSKVDSHLASLYRRAVGGEGPAAVPTVRTVLLNLVAYCRTEREADEAMEAIGEVLGSHPCRAIIIEAMAPVAGEPEDSVAVVCGITRRGDRRLCGEVIRIHAHEGTYEAVGSVMPLLVADVPVYLWILGETPDHDPQFDDLLRMSDTLIVDSRRFSDAETGFNRIINSRISQPDCTVHDLAWISLQSWRELTAQHFDPPSMRPYLNHLTEIVVEYNSTARRGAPPMCALLYISWLINVLALQVSVVSSLPEGGYRIQARQEDNPVNILMMPGEASFAPCQIIASTIKCSADGDQASFTTYGSSDTELSMTEECKGICFPPRVLEMTAQSMSSLVAQALDTHKSDVLYERAIKVAVQIVGELAEVTRRLVREVSEYGRGEKGG